ncbi:cytochrome c oxidase assembly protein [Nocardioides caldifontis]|uniref:cytochrome c oxidase assembly protein n=1 Tax=Nocardioides caldifontis TaxID=2588938 RepID=UPI0011DFFD54|nr:cytochrome c oxidase assembly protein [Nocardioides caldifontis]
MKTVLPRLYAVALILGVPLLAVLLLRWNGALAPPAETGLSDPGNAVRYGLPISRAIRDLSAALTVGALTLTATVLPPSSHDTRRLVTGTRARGLAVASVAGSLWVWSGLANVVFTYGDVAGVDPLAPGGMQYLGSFLTDVELGRVMLLSSTLAAVTAIGTMFTRNLTTTAVLAVVSVVALWPLATTGHAAGDLNHDVAVNAQMAHLLGISVWGGGLAALLLVRRHLSDEQLPRVVNRYSTLAGWAAALVAVSGVTAAWLRLGSWANLSTSYGVLLVIKGGALVTLLGAGAWHRRQTIPALSGSSKGGASTSWFLRLSGAELGVMAAAMAVGVALSRTPTPPGREAATPAEALLGFSMPPSLDMGTFLTQWRVDTFWTPLSVLAVGVYFAGVLKLHRRGDAWPVGRSAAWLIGAAMLIWATSGSPGVYGDVLFSMHMVQHMTIATAAPTFLVLGAPVTLALRTLRARRDGSRGPREWLLLAIHSWYLRVLGNPVVAAGLFVISLVVFYSSSLFELSLRSHTVHLLMVFHFLATGYLLASAICGIDPGPARQPHPLRLVTLLVTFGFHALFSVSLMSKTQVLAEDWFTALGREWGNSPERDQYIGATLGWVLGDYPIAILGFGLIWAWVRSDMREARRYDRRAARDNDEELRRYNEELLRLHERR